MDEEHCMVTKVVYPMDVKMGAANMLKWDLENRVKVGIQSETISRHAVTYFNMVVTILPSDIQSPCEAFKALQESTILKGGGRMIGGNTIAQLQISTSEKTEIGAGDETLVNGFGTFRISGSFFR